MSETDSISTLKSKGQTYGLWVLISIGSNFCQQMRKFGLEKLTFQPVWNHFSHKIHIRKWKRRFITAKRARLHYKIGPYIYSEKLWPHSSLLKTENLHTCKKRWWILRKFMYIWNHFVTNLRDFHQKKLYILANWTRLQHKTNPRTSGVKTNTCTESKKRGFFIKSSQNHKFALRIQWNHYSHKIKKNSEACVRDKTTMLIK